MEEAEARQEEVRQYIIEKPRNIHLICGNAGVGKSFLLGRLLPRFVEDHEIGEVIFVGYCYRHPKTLKDTVVLPGNVKQTHMSLHKLMGVEPHDVMDSVQSADDIFYFDIMCSKATYPALNKDTRTLIVMEEVFFSPRLVASIILFLAGRQNVFVIACGDPGQISRSPGCAKFHASEVFWARLTMDCVRPVDLHVLLPHSFRQTAPALRAISSEIELFNTLPVNTLMHNAESVFAQVIPDAAIMDWMVARRGTLFWFVSSREIANSYYSQYVSLTDPQCFRVMSGPQTVVSLSAEVGMYETAKSLTTKDDRRIPCSTPCTVLRIEGRAAILRVEGYDVEAVADFTSKDATCHPIRPVYFNTLDSIQGNTVKTDMLVHFDVKSRIPDAGLYVCFTRPTSPDIFYCTASFLSRVRGDAMQRRPICHPNARFLYTKT